RIVAAIGREQKPPILREDHAAGALEGVRRAVLPTYRLESPGTSAISSAALHLGKHSAPPPMIMDDRVLDLVQLHIEVSYTTVRHPHLSRHSHLLRHALVLRHALLFGHTLLFRHIHLSSILLRSSTLPLRRVQRELAVDMSHSNRFAGSSANFSTDTP